MESETARLHQKMDALTALLEAQNARLEAQNLRLEALDATARANGQLVASIDRLGAQLDALQQRDADRLERLGTQIDLQSQRSAELLELKADLMPVVNQVVKLTIDELEQIGSEFEGEDLLFLVKRLLRDTQLLLGLLDRIEGAVELAAEVQQLSKPAFHQAVQALDRLERDGIFDFARGGWRIVERIVHEFTPQDIDALGENIVVILNTVKNMTQPQIMAMANNALGALQTDLDGDAQVSLWALLRDLSDPKVRRGMARLINMVKVLADQPGPPSRN